MKRLPSLLIVGLLVLFGTATLAKAAVLPPIKEIKSPKVSPDVFKAAKRKEPIKITSAKDASKYLKGDTLKSIEKYVDFSKQFMLIFAWKGSGGDRLTMAVAESFPEQIFFTLKPGRTKDLRPHVRVFILRSNVKWKVR